MKRSKKMFTVMLALCVALSMAMASVTANAATKKPKKIYLKATSTTVDIKGKVKVSVYKTKPSKASKSVKWKSSNKKVATVSKSGYVTGKKKGTVKITATSKKNKRAKKTIKIKVTNLKAKSVTMSKKSANMYPGQKSALKATVKGRTGFYNQGVYWKSSNTKIATVDSKGNVTAKAAGKATITATERGGSKKATCAVNVVDVTGKVTTDENAKTVTVEATVLNPTSKTMHYLVSTKGQMAGQSMMVTTATPAEVSEALGKISAKAWNEKTTLNPSKADKAGVCNTGKKTIADLATAGVGNKYTDYTRLDVTVKYGDKSYTMQETLKDAKTDDNFSMIYANVANNQNKAFGCITCNSGCYSGVVANELRLMGQGFVPQNLPSVGTKVSVTYSIHADNYVSVKDLKDNANDYVILDARETADYWAKHIDGAVSANVASDTSKMDDTVKAVVDKYGKDKKYAVICYSGNKYAKKASRDLRALGVSADKIYTMEGGMKAWEAANYPLVKHYYASADTVFSKLKDANSVVLDARKVADYDAGHIAGAVAADVDGAVSGSDKRAAAANVKAVVDKYGKDKNYYVICYSGNRYAREATQFLKDNGVDEEKIFTLGGNDGKWSAAGGMKAWNAKYAGYVVAKHTSSKGINFANGITPEHLKADVDGQKVFTVMDVRAKEDYDKGHISNAVSTPSGDGAAVMKAVNDNKNGLYVLVCYSGNAKADEARNTMVNKGVDESRIICLQGGMGTWK